ERADLNPEDKADMLQGNWGGEGLNPAPPVGRLAAPPLIVIDDQDAIPGPPQGDRMVGEGILPLPRLAMVEHLLRVGLTYVNDGDSVEVKIRNLRRSQDARPVGRLLWRRRLGGCPGCRPARIMGDHDRPPCRREVLGAAGRPPG